MSLSRRLSPLTSRLAHILAVKKTTKDLEARTKVANAPLGLFFAGPVGDIYQVTQWLPVFEKINDELPAILFVKDARAASALAKLTRLPIRLSGHADAIEPLIASLGLKVMFYVNNNLGNFSALRLSSLVHIHLSHGESEKVSMVSNQLKAYDFCFVAGQAAADRIMQTLPRFDAGHLRLVGRPQLDELFTAKPFEAVPKRKTVLYAPTWEGDRKAMAYSSVTLLGEKWVQGILEDATLRLIYRPHPKTGSRDAQTLKADRRIRKAIVAASKLDRHSGHRIDEQTDYSPALVSADVAVFDVSAMAMDFRVLQRPMYVYVGDNEESSEPTAPQQKKRIVDLALEGRIIPLVQSLLDEQPTDAAVDYVRRHFGETTPGTSFEKFRSAINELLAK